MKVIVKAFGPISEIIGRLQYIELSENSRVEDLANILEKNMNGKVSSLLHSNLKIVLNGSIISDSNTRLKDGDRIDILSPFAGG